MIVIGDIDDVQMSWAGGVHRACVEAGLTDKPTHTQWNMAEDYGCTIEEWLTVVHSLTVPNGLYHQPPYPGVVDAWKKLVNKGHELHHVTARGFFNHPEPIRGWTRDWIIENDIPGKLWFAENKGDVARAIGATHSIDDRVENVIDLRNAGCMSYIMTQPHNANIEIPGIRRVASVAEFVERILQ